MTGVSQSHDWCVLRREFSGMIPTITSNFIIPTLSNPSIPYVKRTRRDNEMSPFIMVKSATAGTKNKDLWNICPIWMIYLYLAIKHGDFP